MRPSQIRDSAEDLMAEYVERIDSDRLEEWLDLFTEDALYQIVPRENCDRNLPASLVLCTNKNMLRDRIVSLRNANEYNPHYDRHLVSGIRVAPLAEGTWQLTANYVLFQTDLDGHSRLFGVGRYRDKLRVERGQLLIAAKVVIVDTFAVPTLLATPI
jgi:anthranilate 1,2-dioxygenase small subunit